MPFKLNPITGELDLVGGGSGDVVGPASSTDNAIARFDGTTGKLIQNSSVTLDDSSIISGAALITRVVSGSAAVPSYSFVTDPTTGIYNEDGSEIQFAIEGALAMRLDVSGLYLDDQTASRALTVNASKYITASTTTDTELGYVSGVTSAIQTQFSGKASTALSNLASVAINTSLISDADSTDNLGSTSVAWANLYVDTISSITGNALALTPVAGQNMTINLSTTGVLLITSSGTNFEGAITLKNTANAAGSLTSMLWHNSAGTLQAQSVFIDSNYTNASLRNTFLTGSVANIPVLYYTNNLERGRVTAAGLFGFGTTAPDRVLEINSSTGINLRLTYNDSNGSAANYADFLTTSGGDLTITPSGGDTTITGTLSTTGNIIMQENTSIALDPAGSADGKYTGITVSGTAGATLAFGDLIYLAVADSRWELCDADSVTTAGAVLTGMCVLAAAADGSATVILLKGIIRADAAFPDITIGAPVYASTTAGDIQVAQPSGTDDVIHVIGFGLTINEIYFNPSSDFITHT